MFLTVSDSDSLQLAVNQSNIQVNIVSDINLTQSIRITSHTNVMVYSSVGATISGMDTHQIFIIEDYSEVTLRNLTLTNAETLDDDHRGACINLNSHSSLYMESIDLRDSYSDRTRGGGCFYAGDESVVTMDDVGFYNCEHAKFGGGMYLSSAQATITNLRLGNNIADGEPEDIYMSSAVLTCSSTCSAGQYANCTTRAVGDGVDCWANCGSECLDCPAGKANSAVGAERPSSCESCGIGYASLEGSTACSLCGVGTFASNNRTNADGYGVATEATYCAAAPPGYHVPTDGAFAAAVCAAGTYSTGGLSACLECIPGTWSATAQSACNNCTAGRYTNSSSSTACFNCEGQGDNFYSSAGATSCEGCVAGYYRKGDACHECPAGTKCASKNFEGTDVTLETIDVQKGWWRPSEKSAAVYRCPFPAECIGGTNIDEQCLSGSEGPLCR